MSVSCESYDFGPIQACSKEIKSIFWSGPPEDQSPESEAIVSPEDLSSLLLLCHTIG